METPATKTVTYANDVFKTIYERRAVRNFKDLPVDNSVIEQLLDAARMAPSAINKQPWHFYVLNKKETIKAFSKSVIQTSKMAMFKSGIQEAAHAILHPGSFHLKDGINFLKQDDPIFHGAPVVIFITSDKSNEWAALDIGMCAQNIMLAAKSLGLDTCPVGLAKFVEQADVFDKLRIPATQEVNLAIIIGYANEEAELHERKKDNAFFIE